MSLSPRLSKRSRPLTIRKAPVRSCPHCKEGGKVIIGKYITISVSWDAEDGCWHCLICGFIGFGSDFELLRYPIVACVGHGPRLPGQPRKKKVKY